MEKFVLCLFKSVSTKERWSLSLTKVKVKVKVAQSGLTLCDPMNYTQSIEFSRPEY